MLRRQFVRDALAGMAGTAGLLAMAGRREGGTAGGSRLERIGIELFTVRRELAQDPEGTLAQVAAIGYREVEFAGYPPGAPQALRATLDKLGLTAPAAHLSLQAFQGDWEKTVEQAAILGHRYLVIAWIAPEERRDLDAWKRLAAAFDQVGERCRRSGIQFAYHNHDYEFTAIGGKLPYDFLLAETDPKLVAMEMDLYWITKGGQDPLPYFAKWPGRFPLVHIKDMDATPRRFFADVGKGTIDFKRIFRKAGQAGIRHYFYEQDETPGSPFDSAKASYQYLRSLQF
jgi:sugar phosphate isomerase/epimerase